MIKGVQNIDDTPNDVFDDGELDQYVKNIEVNGREGAPSLKGVKITDLTKNKPGSRFWKSVKLTLAGQTTVGLVGREIKNVAKHFVPFGKYADAALDAVGDSLKEEPKHRTMDLGKAIKRALTTDGGGFWRLVDEDGRFSLQYGIAFIVRLAGIVGALYVLNLIGVPVDKAFDMLVGLLEALSQAA